MPKTMEQLEAENRDLRIANAGGKAIVTRCYCGDKGPTSGRTLLYRGTEPVYACDRTYRFEGETGSKSCLTRALETGAIRPTAPAKSPAKA